MNVFGIGIDVVEVERIEASIDSFGDRFLQRVFTESERKYCDAQKSPALHYAARFAGKEAVAKAFGTGIGKDLAWLDMEICRQESGAPVVVLTGNGARFAESHDISEIKISLTHATHYAAGNAMALVSETTTEEKKEVK